MTSSSAVLGVFAVALAMVLTPGPNMMYLVSRSVTQGRRAGVISLIGVAVGFLTVNFLIVLAAGAISVFLSDRPTWLRVQRYLMGSVLGLLAVKLATDKRLPQSGVGGNNGHHPVTLGALLVQGQ